MLQFRQLEKLHNVRKSCRPECIKIDNSRYNDKDDTSGRSGFRLHLGTVSYGCVTINKDQNNSNKMWSVLSGIMGRTSSTRVKEKRGRQWLNPLSQRTWYGKMVVIGGK